MLARFNSRDHNYFTLRNTLLPRAVTLLPSSPKMRLMLSLLFNNSSRLRVLQVYYFLFEEDHIVVIAVLDTATKVNVFPAKVIQQAGVSGSRIIARNEHW